MPTIANMELSGWGNYQPEVCHVFRPHRLRDVTSAVEHGGQTNYISRGLGRSYGDSAVNAGGGVIQHTELDRFLSFNEATGTLKAEAGASLEKIIKTFVPRGWFPPVTPGTRFVTLGGMIAADVHGKNHHADGSIGNFIDGFDLLKADGDVIHCSREKNDDVFRATLGGMGLTGVILNATLRLKKIDSSYINVQYERAANLDAVLQSMIEHDDKYRYSVAWIDCLASGKSLGRSVLLRGDHAKPSELPGALRAEPLCLPKDKHKSVPFNFPEIALNPLSVKTFNALYHWKHGDGAKAVHYEHYFYPLDSVHHWNRMYGKRGFIQYQVALPPEQGLKGLTALLERLVRSKRASFLAVLKTFGQTGEGLLSFPMPGPTLALDLPNRPGLVDLTRELDAIVLDHGGRLYLAKDACMTAATFAKMYPNLDAFRQIKQRIDPDNVFSSSQARRLGIVPGGDK